MIESVDVKTGVSSALARAWQPIMDAGVELVELARGVRRRRKVH